MREPRRRRRVVIVVEDDPPIGQLLRDVINDEDGYLAVHVRRPSEALRAVNTVRPDLLVIDIGLPEMSGIELYDRLRSDPAVSGVPVIFETAIADACRRELRERGVTHVLEKPFDLADVRHSVHRLAPAAVGGP